MLGSLIRVNARSHVQPQHMATNVQTNGDKVVLQPTVVVKGKCDKAQKRALVENVVVVVGEREKEKKTCTASAVCQ